MAALLAEVKRAGKNTWVYSGYRLEELVAKEDPAIDIMLAFTDVLVDGPFRSDLAGHYRWRGSANQRILYLTDAIPPDDRLNHSSRIEIRLNAEGQMLIVGIPPPDFLPRFRQMLAKHGVFVHTPTPWK